MADRYYYFVSSLPLLDFGTKPPQSVRKFLAAAGELATPEDHARLISVCKPDSFEGSSCRNKTMEEWHQYVRALKNELVVLRAHQKGWDPHPYLREEAYPDAATRRLIVELKRKPDPLAAEKLIDQAKWNKLEELSVGHYFDVDFLIIYALKLQILERWQKMSQRRGEKILKKIL